MISNIENATNQHQNCKHEISKENLTALLLYVRAPVCSMYIQMNSSTSIVWYVCVAEMLLNQRLRPFQGVSLICFQKLCVLESISTKSRLIKPLFSRREQRSIFKQEHRNWGGRNAELSNANIIIGYNAKDTVAKRRGSSERLSERLSSGVASDELVLIDLILLRRMFNAKPKMILVGLWKPNYSVWKKI